MIELVGGPYCGRTRSRRAAGKVFVDSLRIHDEPGPGRRLYREAGTTPDGSACFVDAHRTHRVCSSCGAVHAAAEECSLCGGRLVR